MGEFKGFRQSRLRVLTEAELTGQQRAYYEQMMKRSRGGLSGPMNVLMRSPGFAEARNVVAEYCSQPAAGVDRRFQELAILITARFWDADYEWWAHVPKALELGIPRSAIEDIRAGREPHDLSAPDHAVWAFLSALLNERRVSNEVYAAATAVLGEVVMIHLLGLVGHYATLALMLNATETHTPGAPQDELEILYPE